MGAMLHGKHDKLRDLGQSPFSQVKEYALHVLPQYTVNVDDRRGR